VALEHLFDAELHYQTDLDPLVPSEGREGELIGSGDGAAKGAKLAGRLRWSMFAADCLFRPDGSTANGDGDHLCTTNPALLLTTDDGARIWFDAKGYGLRRQADAPNWLMTSSLRFQTEDERYRWLDNAFGLWEGVFDEQARRARYRAYRQTTAPGGRP
jgi:hypothetical protein